MLSENVRENIMLIGALFGEIEVSAERTLNLTGLLHEEAEPNYLEGKPGRQSRDCGRQTFGILNCGNMSPLQKTLKSKFIKCVF